MLDRETSPPLQTEAAGPCDLPRRYVLPTALLSHADLFVGSLKTRKASQCALVCQEIEFQEKIGLQNAKLDSVHML